MAKFSIKNVYLAWRDETRRSPQRLTVPILLLMGVLMLGVAVDIYLNIPASVSALNGTTASITSLQKLIVTQSLLLGGVLIPAGIGIVVMLFAFCFDTYYDCQDLKKRIVILEDALKIKE